jgi:hypothetical protein
VDALVVNPGATTATRSFKNAGPRPAAKRGCGSCSSTANKVVQAAMTDQRVTELEARYRAHGRVELENASHVQPKLGTIFGTNQQHERTHGPGAVLFAASLGEPREPRAYFRKHADLVAAHVELQSEECVGPSAVVGDPQIGRQAPGDSTSTATSGRRANRDMSRFCFLDSVGSGGLWPNEAHSGSGTSLAGLFVRCDGKDSRHANPEAARGFSCCPDPRLARRDANRGQPATRGHSRNPRRITLGVGTATHLLGYDEHSPPFRRSYIRDRTAPEFMNTRAIRRACGP